MMREYKSFIPIVVFLLFIGCKPTPPAQTCIAFATDDMTEWQGCADGTPSILFFPSPSPLFDGDMPSTGYYLGLGYLQLNLPDDDYEKLRSALSERMNLIIEAFKLHTYANSLHEVQMPLVNQQSPVILKQFYSANSGGEGVYVTNPATGLDVLLIDVDYICFANTALLPVLYE